MNTWTEIIIMTPLVTLLAGVGWGMGRIIGIDIYTRFITRNNHRS